MGISTGSHGQRQLSLGIQGTRAPVRPRQRHFVPEKHSPAHESGGRGQFSLDFARAKPAHPPERVFGRAPFPNSEILKAEISSAMLKHAECALTKIFNLLEKANEAGAPYFRTGLAKIFLLEKPPANGGRAHLDAIPTKEQAHEAYALLSMLARRNFYGIPRNEGDLKWRRVCPEHQASSEIMELYSGLGLLASLNSMLQKGEYSDFLLVLDSVEKNARRCASGPKKMGEPRVCGHEIRLCLELRAENVCAKAESLLAKEEEKH